MYHISYNHSPAEGHLGFWFLLWWIKLLWIFMYRFLCRSKFTFLWVKGPRMQRYSCMVVVYLAFKKLLNCFPEWLYQVTFSLAKVQKLIQQRKSRFFNTLCWSNWTFKAPLPKRTLAYTSKLVKKLTQNGWEESFSPYPCQHSMLSLFTVVILIGVLTYFLVVLICIFFLANNVKHLFMWLFEEMSIQMSIHTFCSFSDWIVCHFFLLHFESSL